MKNFEKPVVEVAEIELTDVITTSSNPCGEDFELPE